MGRPRCHGGDRARDARGGSGEDFRGDRGEDAGDGQHRRGCEGQGDRGARHGAHRGTADPDPGQGQGRCGPHRKPGTSPLQRRSDPQCLTTRPRHIQCDDDSLSARHQPERLSGASHRDGQGCAENGLPRLEDGSHQGHRWRTASHWSRRTAASSTRGRQSGQSRHAQGRTAGRPQPLCRGERYRLGRASIDGGQPQRGPDTRCTGMRRLAHSGKHREGGSDSDDDYPGRGSHRPSHHHHPAQLIDGARCGTLVHSLSLPPRG